jgi:hypothetical protein
MCERESERVSECENVYVCVCMCECEHAHVCGCVSTCYYYLCCISFAEVLKDLIHPAIRCIPSRLVLVRSDNTVQIVRTVFP